tara:strand:- start:259 stop:552 length:294 start_codon:yes stop_codon:yes gene_type:complete
MKLKWENYDANWLLKLAEEQIPEEKEIIHSLKSINKGSWESRAYIYFVNPANANMPKSEWQFKENVILTDPKKGEIVLDILKNNIVGGAEFISLIPQ